MPACRAWEARQPAGTHTFGGIRHTHPVCARLATLGRNCRPESHVRLTDAPTFVEALAILEDERRQA